LNRANYPHTGQPGGGSVRDRNRRAVLRDGSEALIRPVRGADAPALADGFARLSARTRHLRFLTGKRELTPKEPRYLTEVDHHDHEALAAVDPVGGRREGMSRFTGLAAADSVAVARLARALGAVLRRGEFGTAGYELSLDALPAPG
jgi:hypothetical protein